jgi:uncharacterized phiE125 gp8 family phage protein
VTHRAPITIVEPDEEPITIEEALQHLRADDPQDDSDDDETTDVLGKIVAAREFCEDFLGESLALRTLEIALDEFPTTNSLGGLPVELPMGPVSAVLSISWGDESDDEMAATDFVLDVYRKPNRIIPVAAGWPSVTKAPNAIKVRYLAGYGDTSDAAKPLPKVIKAAMLLVLEHLYRNRGATTEEALKTLPLGVFSLLRPRQVRMGMA